MFSSSPCAVNSALSPQRRPYEKPPLVPRRKSPPESSDPIPKKSRRRRSRKTTEKRRTLKNRQAGPSRTERITSVLKRSDCPPSEICFTHQDDLSIVSEISGGDFSGSVTGDVSPVAAVRTPVLVPSIRRESSLCSIHMLDGQLRDDEKPWFRVYFDRDSDYVEIQGEEIADFCLSLQDYGCSWIFEVTLSSSGILTRITAQDVVPSLRYLLASASTRRKVKKDVHHRKPWQKDWVFVEFDDEEC